MPVMVTLCFWYGFPYCLVSHEISTSSNGKFYSKWVEQLMWGNRPWNCTIAPKTKKNRRKQKTKRADWSTLRTRMRCSIPGYVLKNLVVLCESLCIVQSFFFPVQAWFLLLHCCSSRVTLPLSLMPHSCCFRLV